MILLRPQSFIAILLTLFLVACGGEADQVEASFPLTDVEAIKQYELSLDVINVLPSVHENIVGLVDEQPDLRTTVLERPTVEELDATFQKLAGTPEIRETIEGAGITVEDYLVTSMLMTAALMEVAFEGMADEAEELPNMIADHHLEFVREHRREIEDVVREEQTFEAMYAF